MDEPSTLMHDANIIAEVQDFPKVPKSHTSRDMARRTGTGYKLEAQLNEDEVKYFFLKLLDRQDAAAMALGEYESQQALHSCLPENICRPVGHGTLAADLTKAFYMTEFRQLTPRLVSKDTLAGIMAKMHSTVSPTGTFGFPVTTFKGYVPVENTWCDTWEEYFMRLFRNDIAWEQSLNGADPEFNSIAEEFFLKVVPRLLRPLETRGKSIRPVLLHGDLWDENIEFDAQKEQYVVFDACCYYGHHESDLASMNCSPTPRARYWNEEGKAYIEKYLELMEPVERKEELWDRLELYTI